MDPVADIDDQSPMIGQSEHGRHLAGHNLGPTAAGPGGGGALQGEDVEQGDSPGGTDPMGGDGIPTGGDQGAGATSKAVRVAGPAAGVAPTIAGLTAAGLTAASDDYKLQIARIMYSAYEQGRLSADGYRARYAILGELHYVEQIQPLLADILPTGGWPGPQSAPDTAAAPGTTGIPSEPGSPAALTATPTPGTAVAPAPETVAAPETASGQSLTGSSGGALGLGMQGAIGTPVAGRDMASGGEGAPEKKLDPVDLAILMRQSKASQPKSDLRWVAALIVVVVLVILLILGVFLITHTMKTKNSGSPEYRPPPALTLNQRTARRT